MNFAAVAIHKKLGPLENGDETFRDHHVSHIEARINYLGKASEIDARCAVFVGRECRQRLFSIPKFAVVVVFNYPDSLKFGPG